MRAATVLVGGSLFDGERHLGPGEVRLSHGVVAEVGPRVDRDDAVVVDVAGGLVLPGFVDAHVHAVQGGMERTRCDLSGADDRDAYLALVRQYADRHPPGADGRDWVLGGGWAMSAFPGGTPLAADLDVVVPDRPVFLPNRDHHGAWVNTRSLERAGITAATPDPPDGRIERDADGRPTGTLHEGAMKLVTDVLPADDDADLDAALVAGQAYLHSVGVTAWQDAIVGAYAGMQDVGPAYRRAAAAGTLTADVVGALWWDRDRGVEQVADLVARRDALSLGRFHATSVKIMADGVAENFSAAMLEPYLDRCGHAGAERGHSFVDAAALRAAVHALDAEGFQVHVHAIGDRSVRDTLDALEGLDPARDHRHHVAHVQVVHPDDVPRFARLGAAPNIQALWACLDDQMTDLTLPFLGPARSRWQYPFGDLHRSGARLVAGSDWPVSTPDPLAAIHVAVNRVDPDTPDREPFLPEQALDLTTALAAYTSGSAWITHRDRRDGAGHLRPGAAADLAVLDRDPFAHPADEIAATRVASTWVGGRVVHGG